MNRIVISVPRVLDSALEVTAATNLVIDTGTIPGTVTAPFTVQSIIATPTETQMLNLVTVPLGHNHCHRVTADVVIPVTLSMTDANGTAFQTHSTITRQLDIVLYLPTESAFPYTITSEATLDATGLTNDGATTTLRNVTFKILTRVTAVTDLLMPAYGYAPINRAQHYQQSADNSFINQPLFPVGKIY